MTRCAVGLAVLLAFAGSVRAVSLTVPNHSFENPAPLGGDLAFLGVNFEADDWDEEQPGLADEGQLFGFDPNTFEATGIGLDTGVFAIPTSGPFALTGGDGLQGGFLISRNHAWMRQGLTDTFVGGADYTLTIAIASSSLQPVRSTDRLQIALYYDADSDPNVESIAIVGSLLVSASEIASYAQDGQFLGSPQFVDRTVQFTLPLLDAAVSKTIGVLIRPEQLGDETDRIGVWDIDNVRLDEAAPPTVAVPTPGSIAMGGALTMLLIRRRRR